MDAHLVRTTARLVTATALALGIVGISGCSEPAASSTDAADETVQAASNDDGIAAMVHGTPIYEADVTAEIQAMREANGLTDRAAWNEFLDSMGYEPETVRDQVVSRRIDEELVRQEMAHQGLEVTEEELDAMIADQKAHTSSEEAWQAFLDAYHWTEESYRESLRQTLTNERLQEAFGGAVDAVDTWLSEQRTGDDVVKDPIPDDVPYGR